MPAAKINLSTKTTGIKFIQTVFGNGISHTQRAPPTAWAVNVLPRLFANNDFSLNLLHTMGMVQNKAKYQTVLPIGLAMNAIIAIAGIIMFSFDFLLKY